MLAALELFYKSLIMASLFYANMAIVMQTALKMRVIISVFGKPGKFGLVYKSTNGLFDKSQQSDRETNMFLKSTVECYKTFYLLQTNSYLL